MGESSQNIYSLSCRFFCKMLQKEGGADEVFSHTVYVTCSLLHICTSAAFLCICLYTGKKKIDLTRLKHMHLHFELSSF